MLGKGVGQRAYSVRFPAPVSRFTFSVSPVFNQLNQSNQFNQSNQSNRSLLTSPSVFRFAFPV
jgi:hypothetical protein